MPTYFFHLSGQIPAHDMTGHECTNDDHAKEHGSFIAHRVGTEKPEMVREGNFISIENEQREVIASICRGSTRSIKVGRTRHRQRRVPDLKLTQKTLLLQLRSV